MIVDNLIVARIVYLLVTPFHDWPAFKHGIIDGDGKTLKTTFTADEAADWTPLQRLICKLKIMLNKVPGGTLTGLTAAYLLAKESVKYDNFTNIHERFIGFLNSQTNEDILFVEEVVANSVASGGVDTGAVVQNLNKKRILKRFKDFKKDCNVNS